MPTRTEVPTIEATVRFFPDVRKFPPFGQHYMPHLVPHNTNQYLGVKFDHVPARPLGAELNVDIHLIYDVNYSDLMPGCEFLIMEEKMIVGKGMVIRQHKSS